VGIAIMAKAYGIPVIAIAGQVKAEGDLLDTMGINAALACVNKIMKLDAIKEEAEKQLYFAGLNAARLIKIGQEI
jgi:Glycerate kinase